MPRLTLLTKLNQLRARSGLSYEALAERACLPDKGYVFRLFNGQRKPNRDVLIRLGVALGLDVPEIDELLGLAHFLGWLAAPAPEAEPA